MSVHAAFTALLDGSMHGMMRVFATRGEGGAPLPLWTFRLPPPSPDINQMFLLLCFCRQKRSGDTYRTHCNTALASRRTRQRAVAAARQALQSFLPAFTNSLTPWWLGVRAWRGSVTRLTGTSWSYHLPAQQSVYCALIAIAPPHLPRYTLPAPRATWLLPCPSPSALRTPRYYTLTPGSFSDRDQT